MGGRGGTSGFSSKSMLDPKAEVQTIETYYRRSGRFGSHYGDSVLKAIAKEGGQLEFEYAQADFSKARPKANTQDATFYIQYGSVTHFNNGKTNFYGINWENVKSVSGQTYEIKSELKDMGFQWDRDKRKWVRK